MSAPDTEPTKTIPSFINEFKSLVAKNIKGNLQLASRLNQLVKQAGKSWGPDRPAGEGNPPALLIRRLLDFNLASYQILSSCTLDMLNELVSAAEKSLLGQAPASPEPAVPKGCGEIKVEARPGQRLKVPFSVENQQNSPLTLSFAASEWDGPSANSPPASTITFEPATLALDPQKNAVVCAVIDISNAFVVGQTYTSTIRVIGFPGKEVRLVLTILPPTEPPQPAKPTEPANPTTKPSIPSRAKRTKSSRARPATSPKKPAPNIAGMTHAKPKRYD